MSGSGTNRIADYGDGGFQILFFSLFAALSELYSRVDVSQWVDIFFEESYLNSCICIFTSIFEQLSCYPEKYITKKHKCTKI